MKLIKKTQRIYLSLVVVLLFIWSIIFLFAIYSAVEENIDETMHSELLAMIHQPKSEDFFQPIANQQMEVTSISTVQDTMIHFSDTTLFNSIEHENFPYRQVQTQRKFGAKTYRITLRRSMVEYDDLFETILIMELIFIALLIAGLFLINKKILERLWHPFQATLKQVNDYKIGKTKNIIWKETEIDEFRQLNQVLQQMIQHIEQEYKSLKEFTENASHEIQTPLSVIANKVEILLQDDSLGHKQKLQLYDIQQTAAELSRLNKALLMLTKIENEQFTEKKEVIVSRLLEKLIQDYRTLAETKNVKIQQQIEPNMYLNTSTELTELMLRNLLSNAVKHNYAGGYIDITLNGTRLLISNTGKLSTKNPAQFFERFQKGRDSQHSLGLGLSIVSAIAKTNKFGLKYLINDNIHTIEIRF